VRSKVLKLALALVAIGVVTRGLERPGVANQPTIEPVVVADADDAVGDRFIYDVATRFNETLFSSIDAIDTALTAILAGDVAVVIFAVDKIRELHPAEEWCAIVLVCGSVLSCVIGYVFGSSVRASGRDGVLPRRFIPDVIARPSDALPSAVNLVIEAGEKNLTVRFVKRTLVITAMALLLSGGVLVMLARLAGHMVN
jgi:hypothetical protein